ncbi:S8 family serine peptidase [Mycoplasma simbae]|uniref:S8 family serine peptidase n=1 Tax=Mycoplasma simbae TaxID=36744 RepID=UPI000496F1D3|nr:S8 family serine peptidase [Mycoplasma simbae]
MKRKNIILSTILTTIPCLSLSSVSAKITDKNSYINNINITEYNTIKNLLTPYYHKLGLGKYLNKVENYNSTDFDKVGIIEVDDVDSTLLLSKNPNFTLVKIKNEEEHVYGDHGFYVTSIVGTDLGINKNARVYFDYIYEEDDDADNILLKKVKYMHQNHGISLFNMSLGHEGSPYNYLREKKSKSDKNNKKKLVKTNASNYAEDTDLLNAYHYLCELIVAKLYLDDNDLKPELRIFNKNQIRKKYLDLEEYAVRNDIKIVKSTGNINHDFKVALNKTLFFEENGYIFGNLVEKIRHDFDTILTPYMNSDAQSSSKFNSFDFELLNSILNENEIFGVSIKTENLLKQSLSRTSMQNSYLDWQNLTYCENFINVGSVDFNNTASYFSSYNDNKHEDFPLVSAYGNSLYSDRLFINSSKYKNHYEDFISLNIEEHLKSKLVGLTKFLGTSKAAPMITGLISLLQHELQKNLSLAETKLILASSSTYSSKTDEIKITNSYYLTSPNEFLMKNLAKSKTGYGIPKFFKMLKIAKSNNLKNHISDINKLALEQELKINFDTNLTDISIKKGSHLTTTSILVKKLLFEDFLKILKNKEPELTKEVDEANKYTNQSQNRRLHIDPIGDRDNIKLNSKISYENKNASPYGEYTELIFKSEYSDSTLSDIERTYFLYNDNANNAKFSYSIVFKELDYYLNSFWHYALYKTGNQDDYIWYGYGDTIRKRYPYMLSFYEKLEHLRDLYFEYLKKYTTLLSYTEIH